MEDLKGELVMRRTTATTEYLKECMGTALLELMKEKPIEKISIEEMTAKADVGRSTYFRYFKSKDEVLVFKIHCLWNRFAEENRITDFRADMYTSTRLFFEFCLSIRDINDPAISSWSSEGYFRCIFAGFKPRRARGRYYHLL